VLQKSAITSDTIRMQMHIKKYKVRDEEPLWDKRFLNT
jgi:hypothetical protein